MSELHKEPTDSSAAQELPSQVGETASEEVTSSSKNVKFQKKKPLWKRIAKVCMIIGIILLGMILVAVITYTVLYHVGKSSMLDYDDVTVNFSRSSEEQSVMEEIEEPTTTEQVIAYDDGKTVVHEGHTYRLNENISTILIIGVDKYEIEGEEIHGNGGEADCILLAAIDTETGDTKVLNISREAYAQVDIYSASGSYLESRSTQLCRAYAYGDGAELSCENTVKSVKRLLYGLPIHSYIALDMRFVGAATNAVNGITLNVLADVLLSDGTTLIAGTQVNLWGQTAERYVRWRDKTNLDSNEIRMERQKQFIQLFISKAIAETKGDLTTILDIYNAMSDYMTTELSLADATFLLTCILENGVKTEFLTLEGKTVKNDINAMFYIDEASLFQTVLDVFYTKIN